MYIYYIETLDCQHTNYEKALNNYFVDNPDEELVNVIKCDYNNGYPYIKFCTRELKEQ